MYKVKLKNDFHNTTVTVIPQDSGRLSRRQMRRIRKALCGRDDCSCGPIRGPQDVWYEPDLAIDGNGNEYETYVIYT